MRKSISVAFFSTVATLMILGVAVMGLSQLVLFSRYFAQERFATLDDVSDLAARTAAYVWDGLEEMNGQDKEVGARLENILSKVDLIGQSANVYIFFTDSSGRVALASNSDHLTGQALPAEVLEAVAAGGGEAYHEMGRMDGVFDERFYVSARYIQRAGGPGVYLFVCASGQMLEDFVARFGSNFLLSACLMLVFASALTMVLMRSLTDPLHRISEAAQKFGGGDFSVRVEDVDGDGEIADLARTFNTMAANLQQIDSSRGQFMKSAFPAATFLYAESNSLICIISTFG
ncbi:MAG TPA: HAMP domain-containing protein [Candidatus Faecalibacterium faecipullorum]|uniref:HAMP domain-containing protein n=1 Tax=Candidatus Faecalibacterium faecipullorum TaxID=2838578 RepID=A0A9D2MFK2_9FIRM|nr:HAMP domain-containing protein [Candidatus Faecalibacterium faecipullorum]